MAETDREFTPFEKKIAESVGISQPLVIVRTEEWEDAEMAISNVCKELEWGLWVWDSKLGLQDDAGKVAIKPQPQQAPPPNLPPGVKLPPNMMPTPGVPGQAKKGTPHQELVAAIDTLAEIPNKVKTLNESEARYNPVVLVVRNMHLYWAFDGKGDPNHVNLVLTTFQSIVKPFKEMAKIIIGISVPGVMPPQELYPVFEILDHKIPTKDEFKPVLECVEPPDNVEAKLSDKDMEAICEASCGLTRLQAEKSYATAVLRLASEVEVEKKAAEEEGRNPKKIHLGQFFCGVVEEEKNLILNADGMLKRWNGPEDFDSIGGNEALKEYLKRVMQPEARRRRSKRNCTLLLGPPGTGKTLLAKALGKFTGRKTYGGNLSSNKSKWVGESEANARRMFARASAMSNIILYFDEVNEQIAGGESDGHSVDTALRQYTMEWLDTHWREDDVFCVMTANDMSKMHMALTRPGRVDAVWYVGLPGKKQKQAIWHICISKYALAEGQYEELPDDYGWAGVEIDACCATADNFGVTLKEAAKYIIPSSVRVKEQIESLKQWADSRCLDAETGELFKKDQATEPMATGSLGGIGSPVKRKVTSVTKKTGK